MFALKTTVLYARYLCTSLSAVAFGMSIAGRGGN